MKKNLPNFWLKNNISILNLATLLLYLLGWWLWKQFGFPGLINLLGVFYLLILTPLNLLVLLKFSSDKYLDWLFASLTIFFSLIVPFFFFLNYYLRLPLSVHFLLIFTGTISGLTLLFHFQQLFFILRQLKNKLAEKKLAPVAKLKQKILSLGKKNWPLWLSIILFSGLHLINYHFYVFLPEWDGYSKLLEIREAMRNGYLENSYRGFFTIFVISIAEFAKISPYIVFTNLIVTLQITLTLSIFGLSQLFKIKNKFHQFVLLLTTISVPIINLEVDAIRPQNVFIILAPIYFYFLFQALKRKKLRDWLFSSLIVLGGLNYHEFFGFLLLIHFFAVFITITEKYLLRRQQSKDRLIFVLSLTNLILLAILLIRYLSLARYLQSVAKNIITQIQITAQWRWWFLGNYAADGSGQNLGWPGFAGAIKYYAYYLSPAVLLLLGWFIYLTISKKINKRNPIFIVSLFLLTILIGYSEILPRLNYIYLPERVWLITDILLLSLSPFILSRSLKIFSEAMIKKIISLLFAASLIGIIGTFYIAKNKKALTSPNEFQAAQWIRENTSPQAIFITQGANGPMVRYFANREILLLSALSSVSTLNLDEMLEKKHSTTYSNKLQEIRDTLNNQSLHTPPDLENLIGYLLRAKRDLEKIYEKENTRLQSKNLQQDREVYILYSLDKFNNMYAQREWWLKANYYGLDIDQITKKYPLVYNENRIYIWQVKNE